MKENKIVFVINPVAGGKKKENIIRVIAESLSKKTPYDVFVWEEKNNFEEIRKQITSGKYKKVVAVGGDGTVNEVAKNLIGTGIDFGIIPRGSGNGLARTLGIPQDTRQAIETVECGTSRTIDCGFINGLPFFCTSGVGFDAHIGKLFAMSKKRGLSSYFKITTQELIRYRAATYEITANGKTFTTKAFLVTFANAGQYGNDFYIAPQAKLDDGKLHIAVMKPFSPLTVWPLLGRILQRKAHLSPKIQTLVADEITIRQPEFAPVHYDGEPSLSWYREFQVKIQPAALQVIC